MAVQLINIGNFANDGTGDDLREAFFKVNQNFEDLDLRNDERTTASNIGGQVEIFDQRVGYDLQFKTLQASPSGRITISSTPTDTIRFDAVGGEWRFVTNSGTYFIADGLADQIVHLKGQPYPAEVDPGRSDQVYVSYEDGEIRFRINPKLKADNSPTLGGRLDANFNDVINGGQVTATQFNGPLQGLVYGVDVRNFSSSLNTLDFDFGNYSIQVTNIWEWLTSGVDVDLGTIVSPDQRNLDFGAFQEQ